ncbi:MAG: DUF7305 domain-containing protein [Deltaproteobacteria bacterium]
MNARIEIASLALALALAACCKSSLPALPDGGRGTTGGSSTGGRGATGGTGSGGQTGGSSGGASCGLNSEVCQGQCVVVLTDPKNCGGCGVACAAGQVCSVGVCGAASSCPQTTTACAGSCVDLATDNANCGGCGNACPSGQGCAAGACVKAVGLTGQTPPCPNGGPPIEVGVDAGVCTGDIAQVTFRWALCTCDQVANNGGLTTDAFDSQLGPYDGGPGGAVGADQSFSVNGPIGIGGSLWVAGSQGVALNTQGSAVGLELHSGGPLTSNGGLAIASNAFVDGSVQGQVAIGGTLYVPASANVGPQVTSKGVVQGPVTVTPPCDCAASQLLDIAGIVANGKQNNDDATVGLDPTVFDGTNNGLRLDLPCGRYYLSAVTTNGVAAIAVHGRTAIFVGGDVAPNGGVEFTLDPNATLDLFVGGSIAVNGGSSFGSTLVPAQTRIYAAGNASFNGSSIFAGNFYLPTASVAPNGDFTIYGSIFSGSYSDNGATVIHYDSAILEAGAECGPPDGGAATDGGAIACQSCRDCGNQACINGRCGACQTSADCCAPLICTAGRCGQGFE